MLKSGGGRRKISSYLSKDDEEVYYFFLPSAVKNTNIKILNNLDKKRWNINKKDFEILGLNMEDNQGDIWIQIEDQLNGEEHEICIRLMQSKDQVTIFVDAEDAIESLTRDKELESKGTISIYDKNDLSYSNSIVIKGHGKGSWEHNEKKSWKIDFEYPVSILGLKPGKSYIAVSNAQDVTYLRNKFVYDFAESIGLNYSPGSKFADLYINGEYCGLYLIVEKPEVSEDRISISEYTEPLLEYGKNELVYYKTEAEKGYLLPEGIKTVEKTGYFLREESGLDRYDQVKSGFITEKDCMFGILYPKTPVQNQIFNIRSFVQQFEYAVNDESGYYKLPEGGEKHYSQYIDLDSFVKKYLIEQISKNYDGNRNSSYYYLPDWENEAILYAGPVWDYDIAFGNYETNAMFLEPKGIISLKPGLDEHEEFMQLVTQYYIVYFKPYLETQAENYIRAFAENIESSVKMDQVRWKGNKYWKCSPEEGIENLIAFIQVRKQFMDDVWINGKIFHRINFVNGEKIVRTIYVEEGDTIGGVMKEPYILRENERMFKGWYGESSEELDYDAVIVENMAFWAEWE